MSGVVVSGLEHHLPRRHVEKILHFLSSLSNDLGILGGDCSSHWKGLILPPGP